MAKKPSQQIVDEDGGAEFFAPVTNGYQKTDTNPGTGAGMPPPPPAIPQPAIPQPAAKPLVQAPVDMSTPKGVSDALATTMVYSFVERMKAAAKAKGGHLTVQDMEDMQDECDRQTHAPSGSLERAIGPDV